MRRRVDHDALSELKPLEITGGFTLRLVSDDAEGSLYLHELYGKRDVNVMRLSTTEVAELRNRFNEWLEDR